MKQKKKNLDLSEIDDKIKVLVSNTKKAIEDNKFIISTQTLLNKVNNIMVDSKKI